MHLWSFLQKERIIAIEIQKNTLSQIYNKLKLCICGFCGKNKNHNFAAMDNNKLLTNWQKKTLERTKLYKKFLHRADKKITLRALPDLSEEAYENINCLTCANCCKNYSPRFKATDVKRIAKVMQMKEGVFIETYLTLDEDNDYVTRSKPCPFLAEDNFCSIYEDRPSDCMRFPYTDEDVIIKRQDITLKNSTFCPIVYFVLEKLMEKK